MLRCPECNTELEHVAGQFDTGVVAPDGYRESYWQKGFYCRKCDYTFEADELPDEEANTPESTNYSEGEE